MRPSLVLCVILTACAVAPMSENECRTSNWYALGERDALSGARPQIERYAEQCSRHAVQPAENDYLAGWGVGYSEWNQRVSRGRM